MNKKKVLGAIIGVILAIVPVLGFISLFVLFLVRKKYKLMLIPAFGFLIFIIAIVSSENDNSLTLIREQETSLNTVIENQLFSLSFDKNKLSISEITDTIEKSLESHIDFENLNADVKNRFREIVVKYYSLYEYKYYLDSSANQNFTIPFNERENIKKEIEDFTHLYAQYNNPESNFSLFFIFTFIFLYFFSVPFSGYAFYKYLYGYSQDIEGHKNRKRTVEFNDNNNTFSTSSEKLEEQVEQTPQQSVKINYISADDIKDSLKLTIVQAQYIINERENNGDFLNYSDFIKRCGLSERVCLRFKDSLDFSINNENKSRGRVFDF